MDFRAAYKALAATTTDLSMDEAQRASVEQAIQGPGTRPPLADQADPAAPGGPAPYNGAEPFGAPVAPDPLWMPPVDPQADPSHRGRPMPHIKGPNQMNNTLVNRAFVERVQASLQAIAAEPKNTPVCRGCGEAFENRQVAEQAHGKRGCGTEDGERGYEMKRESDAW